jgi:signal transduction histidine kinase
MDGTPKLNCWEARGCGRGPDSPDPCQAATDVASDGVNDGVCAGRICWTVPRTGCLGEPQGSFVDKLDTCLICDFFERVKAEQGDDFRLLKLGQGVSDAPELHATIARIESFLRIPEDLHAQFDLRRLLGRITDQAQRTVSAERSVVFLIEGDTPVLRGEMSRAGERVPIEIPLTETSAVGCAALRNRPVNVRDPYGSGPSPNDTVAFNTAFDAQCGVRTRSLLAVPIRGSDGRPIGVITAANSERGEFGADDQWFMEQYALQAGLAVEKAGLLADTVLATRLATFGEALSGLSHSLRGITHALNGLAYIIRQAVRAGRTQDVEAACQILDRQVQRIVQLSRAVSEYESQRGGPERGELNEVVADVVRTLAEEANARAVVLQAELDDDLAAGECERVLLYRCLLNLLADVLQSSPATGGRVVVRTRRTEDEEAVVEVIAEGWGPDLQLASGAPSWRDSCQAHATERIGLPTAQHLLRALGGRLDTEVGPGPRAAYRLHLPVHRSRDEHAVPVGVEPVPPPDGGAVGLEGQLASGEGRDEQQQG